MAAGTTIKLKRKAGAFIAGDLAIGELGLDTTNSILYGSIDGSTVFIVNTVGSSGLTTQVLVGGGAGVLPVWTNATGTGSPVRAESPTITPVDTNTSALTVSGAWSELNTGGSGAPHIVADSPANATWSISGTGLGLNAPSGFVGNLIDFRINNTEIAKIDYTGKLNINDVTSTGNVKAVNVIGGFTSTATAAGTTTLTNTSTYIQEFTGATTQTVILPTTSIVAGQSFKIINNSTGAVTVQSSGANTILVMPAGYDAVFTALVATPTAASHWSDAVANATHTGDATGSGTLTVVALNGTNLAGLGTGLLKNTTGTGVPSIALNSDLPVMTATVGGAVPTPPNNTTTFLRGDGTFATPAVGGDVSKVGTPVNNQVGVWTGDGTLEGDSSLTFDTTTDTLTVLGTIELGNASDTTISRSSAGVIAVEGVVVPTISSTNTFTNKRFTPRVTSITSSATPTVNTDNCDVVTITALAAAITSMTTNLTGTPTDFQQLIYRIKDNGTARAITWGASFAARGAALPTTTVISKVLYVMFLWNSTTSTWDCVSTAQEA